MYRTRLSDNLISTTTIVASEGGQPIPTPLQPDEELHGEFKSLGDVHATQQSTPDFDIQAFHVHSVLDEPRSIPDRSIAIRFESSNDSVNTSTRQHVASDIPFLP
jgi:hypothetical protein